MPVVINPTTHHLLEAISRSLPQALLLTGPDGVGLESAASIITNSIDSHKHLLKPEKNETVDLESGIINVQHIRDLYNDARVKRQKPFFVIIKSAETMTVQAQNAFLKLLEEPSKSVYFILLAHDSTRFLPTLLSRAQHITIRPITEKQSLELLDKLGVADTKKRAQIMFIARGLPAEMTRLVRDDEYFDYRAGIIRDSRQLLSGSAHDKMRIIQTYRSDRGKTLRLLNDIINMLKLNLSKNDNTSKTYISQLDLALSTYERVNRNANIRLALAQFVL